MALDSVTASDVMDDVITPTIENDEVELLMFFSALSSRPPYVSPRPLGPINFILTVSRNRLV